MVKKRGCKSTYNWFDTVSDRSWFDLIIFFGGEINSKNGMESNVCGYRNDCALKFNKYFEWNFSSAQIVIWHKFSLNFF